MRVRFTETKVFEIDPEALKARFPKELEGDLARGLTEAEFIKVTVGELVSWGSRSEDHIDGTLVREVDYETESEWDPYPSDVAQEDNR